MNLRVERWFGGVILAIVISYAAYVGADTNNWYFYIKRYMARNTSILLSQHFEEFISAKISSGQYNSASEVIRTALRLLEAEEAKLQGLNKALLQGEKSGLEKNFDQKKHLTKLHSKHL